MITLYYSWQPEQRVKFTNARLPLPDQGKHRDYRDGENVEVCLLCFPSSSLIPHMLKLPWGVQFTPISSKGNNGQIFTWALTNLLIYYWETFLTGIIPCIFITLQKLTSIQNFEPGWSAWNIWYDLFLNIRQKVIKWKFSYRMGALKYCRTHNCVWWFYFDDTNLTKSFEKIFYYGLGINV